MTERAVSTTGQGPRVVWRRDELAVGALAECFQSFIRPRGAGRSVVRRLEGSIKWAAVSRLVGGERPLTRRELARVRPLHRRVWRRRRLRGGPLRASYERIAKRRGKPIAKVAVARKILNLCFYGLRDGEIRCLAPRAGARTNRTTAVSR